MTDNEMEFVSAMANPKDLDAALALWRFGLGAKEGSISAIKDDPRDLLLQEVTEKAVPTPQGGTLRSTPDLLVSLYEFQAQEKAERERPASPAPAMDPTMAQAKPEKRPYLPQQILLDEVDARFNGTIHEPMIGFGERLAMFWSNHFAIATGKSGEVHIAAGAFEREAIRPNLFGTFEEMLIAVETHPAMLVFLDNRQSVGPNSPANKNGKRGLNENLAREIMELHTLGVDGGYTQADVTSFARIITGWTVYRNDNKPGPQGTFSFNANAHEPGDHTVIGTTYAEGGVEQGKKVLRDLARSPATARHIALKLARHFVADAPPSELVTRMAAAYTKSGGNLSVVYKAMLTSDQAWEPSLQKLRPPVQYLAALLRSTGLQPKPQQIVSTLRALGQPLWDPSGPNGFSDVADGWASSEGLATRIDAANCFAHLLPGSLDPRSFAADRLGPLLSDDTLQAISRAETRPQGLSLAFLSPEFQRC